MRPRNIATALLVAGAVVGCTRREESASRAAGESAAPATAADTAAASATAPDTTGEALWARLQRENYQNADEDVAAGRSSPYPAVQ
jgi:hypothetical protein